MGAWLVAGAGVGGGAIAWFGPRVECGDWVGVVDDQVGGAGEEARPWAGA